MSATESLRDRRRTSNKARDTYCPLVFTLLILFPSLVLFSLSHGYCIPVLCFTIDRDDRPYNDARRKNIKSRFFRLFLSLPFSSFFFLVFFCFFFFFFDLGRDGVIAGFSGHP